MASAAAGPLEGIRVIEFGQLLAGPHCGTLLGDFGADVIKIEQPPDGDPMRQWGTQRHDGRPLWWSVLGRNKRSVTLDLAHARGREIAADLCAGADVIVENFKPGTMERFGLGPAEVHARNPRCIIARISGYGQTGAYRDRPGFAAGGEAMAGLRAINGYPDQAPPRSGISLGDTVTAQAAFQGILLALYARERGAGGQVIDAAIVDSCLALTEAMVIEYEKTGFVRQPTGTVLPKIAPSNVYRSSDGRWVVIAANHDGLWKRLAALMGRAELGDDERFSTHRARGEHQALIDEIVQEWAQTFTAAELDERINAAGVVCAPVYTAEEIARDPWFREQGLLVDREDEVHGTIPLPAPVPRLSVTPGGFRHGARWTVGADTDEVLSELAGISADELARLRADGAV